MAAHALRGMVTAGLVIVAVETLARSRSTQVSSFFSDTSGIVARVLSSRVPLIPDRRPGAKAAAADSGGYFHMTPAQLDAAVRAANTAPAIAKASNDPNSFIYKVENLPPMPSGATPGVDWSAVANSLNHPRH